ncbi:prepilin-type N-terminal cleavage/methylation domain-containing protein [Campylobacter sp. 2018MI35]|uniref:type II secretion system protein n=1 Tax=Campylobacter molothri TaxID=1032242 RepID=UPI001906C338|nr:prepilin-type N-terminal cleavage/methylation domain-containing protein [Campylobacter sp. 2018MI35]MBK2001216.1 prepilin-type N-terminal cleavage/methylation domain-containing protein [Campylobacter sp. 2018MI35]
MKKAFTLLELVFVVLILGILIGISLNFSGKNKDEAKILKLKIDYEMLSSALSLMRTQAELKEIAFIANLDQAKFNTSREKLFYCVDQNGYSLLDSPIYSDFNSWMKIAINQYRFFLNSKEYIDFIYHPNDGILECINSKYCKDLQ